MLNYMKSEWYRQRNNRGLQNTILVCLGLIILMVAVLAFFGRRPGFAYANTYFAFNGIFTSMSGIFPLTLVFAGFMENNSRNRQSPLKNSVAFGIPRSSIYLGKIPGAAADMHSCLSDPAGCFSMFILAVSGTQQ